MTATKSVSDIFGFRKITKKGLLESCKKNKLYRTPELNDVLYLHYQGYEDIECLEEYTGLKCLWLECNAISKISGLDNQKLLKCLFIHNNVIKKIDNLEFCPELDTINLSHNHIIKIENCGIDKLPVLTSLNLSHNYLKTYDSLVNLIDCKMISVLDLANNRIEDILCVKIFAQMPELRVLVLQGNPVVNQIPQYRKTLILDCLNLTYLDSRPVFPRDRACAEAWKQGGYEAERIEHARWNREERKKIRQSVNATLRLKNRGGGDPQAHLLMSSDDEDAGITELSSAPSLEKDQAGASSSKLVKNCSSSSDDDEEDSDDTNMIRSIPLFKVQDNNSNGTGSLYNSEQRCIVCARPNCNVEHIKKRKRIRNLEQPEVILEDTLIFDLIEEKTNTENSRNDENEENKLYNDVYHKNIQYINEAVSINEIKNEEEKKDSTIIDQNDVSISPSTDSPEKDDFINENNSDDNEKDVLDNEKGDSVDTEKDSDDSVKDVLDNEKCDSVDKEKDSDDSEKDVLDNEKGDSVDTEKDSDDSVKDVLDNEKGDYIDKEKDSDDNEKDFFNKENDPVDDVKDSFDIKESFSLSTEELSDKDKLHKSENLSQLLIRCHEQDSDNTELCLAPPLKKFKLSDQENDGEYTFNTTSKQFLVCSSEPKHNRAEDDIKELIQLQNDTENNSEKSLNLNSDVEKLDDTKNDNLRKQIISYNNIYNANNEYITEFVDQHDVGASNDEETLKNNYIDNVNSADDSIQSADNKNENLEKTDDISNMVSINEIEKEEPQNITNVNRAENLEIAAGESLKNIDKKVQELINFNCSFNLLNTLPAVFSSKLYLGTDTNINSAIALYEMSHRNDYNSENETDDNEFYEPSSKIITKNEESIITIDKELQPENLKSKMEIINRLLNDPITKTFQYDSTKINEEFEILKNDEIKNKTNSRLKIFIENQNKKIDNNHSTDSSTTTNTIHASKSDINLHDNEKSDDDGKALVETHSSDTRILKIQYNI